MWILLCCSRKASKQPALAAHLHQGPMPLTLRSSGACALNQEAITALWLVTLHHLDISFRLAVVRKMSSFRDRAFGMCPRSSRGMGCIS